MTQLTRQEKERRHIRRRPGRHGLISQVPAPPRGQWLENSTGSAICAWVQRHFLALGLVVEREGHRQFLFYTGFVLQLHDQLHWITAGHCIEELAQVRDSTEWTIRIAHWYDNYPEGPAAVRPASITDMVWKHGTVDGADIGVVWLRPNDVDNLNANPNFSPFPQEAWSENGDAKPAVFILFGYPSEARIESRVQLGTRERLSIRQSLFGVPIGRFLDRNKMDDGGPFWSHPHSLYAELLFPRPEDRRQLKDIKGMSGGPIISMERTGDGLVGYRLWAVQSSWNPENGFIRAEPISLVVKYLDYVYSEFKKYVQRSKPIRAPRRRTRATNRSKRS